MEEGLITTEKENSKGSNKSLINEEHVNDEQQQLIEEQSKPGSEIQIIKGTEEEGDEKGQDLEEAKEETYQEVKEENDQEVKEENDQEVKEENDQEVKKEKQEDAAQDKEEEGEEEVGYVEEPPPDPAAPLNLSDSQEALKPRFQLRPEQLAEIEQLWDMFQDYTPAYTDIDDYITEKELVYMLKSLLLMTYTHEQFQELVTYCVRPPHPQGHITFDQFLKIATIRQRDFPVEDELRAALQVLDTGKQGMLDREYMKDVLLKQGYKMPPKQLNNLIKEVDISNDGTIGIEDVVGTMCIDLTTDDMFTKKEDDEENPNE